MTILAMERHKWQKNGRLTGSEMDDNGAPNPTTTANPISFTVALRARVRPARVNAFGPAQTFYFGLTVGELIYAVNLIPSYLRTADGRGNFSNHSPLDTTSVHDYLLRGTVGLDPFTVTVDHTMVLEGTADEAPENDHVDLSATTGKENPLVEISTYSLRHTAIIPKLEATLLLGSGLAGLVAWRRFNEMVVA